MILMMSVIMVMLAIMPIFVIADCDDDDNES